MNQNNRNNSRYRVRQAVAMAFAVMSIPAAHATCTTGSLPATDANTVSCTEASVYTNPANTTVENVANVATGGATSSVVQLEGNGNRFSNAGTLSNTSLYTNTSTNAGEKYGVFVGAPTATTSLRNTINNSGSIYAEISAANFSTLGGNANRINTATVVGVGTDAAGEYVLNNRGTIEAVHNGVGRVNGVEAGGDVETMTVINSGTITGTAANAITRTTSTATSFQGTTAVFATPANIGVTAGVYAEEEVEELVIENAASGVITGNGTYASGVYTRAGSTEIVNEGTITGSRIGVAMVSDTGIRSQLTLENSGAINGDVLSVNGNALRWLSLSSGEGTGGANLDSRLNINNQYGQADSTITNSGTINGNIYLSNGTHLLTNKDGGTITGAIDIDQRDTGGFSTSCNVGDTGNHCWDDAATVPTTTGIQRGSEFQSENLKVNVTNITTTGGTFGRGVITFTPTVVGTKDFTFENAGDFDGDITLRTAVGTLADGKVVSSKVTLIPTITGSGANSSVEAPSQNIAGLGQTLTIDASAGAGTVTIAPKSVTTLHVGEYFQVAETLILSGGATTPLVSSINTPLVNWNIVTNSNDSLVIGVDSVNSAASIAGLSPTSIAAIDALLTSDTAIGGTVQGLSEVTDIEQAGQQLRPEANNASTQSVLAVVNRVSSTITARLDEVRVASAGNSGISTGEAEQGIGFWVQGFGFRGDQDERDGIDGYSADTGGFALGGDTLLNNGDFRIGAAFSYASTNVESDGLNTGNRVDIDSYQGALYGTWNSGAWYLDTTLGYGRHQYDTRRSIVAGSVADTATGRHDGNQYLVKVGAGYAVPVGKAVITPLASLTYVRLDQDGYTETSTSGAALAVDDTQTDSLRTGLGAKVQIPVLDSTFAKTIVEARVIWNHEFGDDSQDVTARFAAGGSSFTTNGVGIARDSANVGLGLNMVTTDHQTLAVNYDAEVRSDYIGHTASLQYRYDF